MKHHYGWIIILLGALVVACSSYKEPPKKPYTWQNMNTNHDSDIVISGSGTIRSLTPQEIKELESGKWGAVYTPDKGWIQRDEFIMMEIVSIKKPGLHFFKKGYKRGDKYWYFDGRRVKPLPKNWLVWDYRTINE